MEKNILTINIGSSSKKYALIKSGSLVFGAHFEKIKGGFVVTCSGHEESISEENYNDSLRFFYEKLVSLEHIFSQDEIDAIGFRVVAPGTYFTLDYIVDEDFLTKLKALENKDRVHIEPMLLELQKIFGIFTNTKVIAVSDSAFHKDLPDIVRNYSIPEKIAEKLDLYRFGYHGVALTSITQNEALLSVIRGRVIVCHLGSGVSVTALKNGKSIDTSMGYLPLNGPIMSSRVGDIDSGAVMALLNSTEDTMELFYQNSGLLGLSELSSDMRVLLLAEKEGNPKAQLAIDTFVYGIRKYIGAYASALGGVDALVFSGTIGERSHVLRERICEQLEFIGIKIDINKNQTAVSGGDVGKGEVPVYVLNADEAMALAITASKYL